MTTKQLEELAIDVLADSMNIVSDLLTNGVEFVTAMEGSLETQNKFLAMIREGLDIQEKARILNENRRRN